MITLDTRAHDRDSYECDAEHDNSLSLGSDFPVLTSCSITPTYRLENELANRALRFMFSLPESSTDECDEDFLKRGLLSP